MTSLKTRLWARWTRCAVGPSQMSMCRSIFLGDGQPQRGVLWSPDGVARLLVDKQRHLTVWYVDFHPIPLFSVLVSLPLSSVPGNPKSLAHAQVSCQAGWARGSRLGAQGGQKGLEFCGLPTQASVSPHPLPCSSPSSVILSYPRFCDKNLRASCWLPPLQSQTHSFPLSISSPPSKMLLASLICCHLLSLFCPWSCWKEFETGRMKEWSTQEVNPYERHKLNGKRRNE